MFHPAMTLFTVHTQFTACFLSGLDFIREVPKVTFYWFISIFFRISPKILNVVGVYTLITFMAFLYKKILLGKWTPDSLVLVKMEIIGFLK